MSILNQRNFFLNISSFIIYKRFIFFDDDKIKINKFDIYYKDCNELNDLFI